MGGHVSTTSLSESQRRKSIGTALFARILKDVGVSELDALNDRWRNNLIPKESEEGRKLCRELEPYDQAFAARKRLSTQMINSFLELENRLRSYFESRIEMYKETLKDKKASAQLQNLIRLCSNMYKSSYDNAFNTQVEWGESESLEEWTNFANKEILSSSLQILSPVSSMSSLSSPVKSPTVQSANTLLRCFEDSTLVVNDFNNFFNSIASRTNGVFGLAPMKHMFRAFEKTAMRDETRRYMCDNVYDIVRGNLIYDNMADIVRAAKLICSSNEFVVKRIKDRFTPGNETSGGWRDALINGYFRSDRNMHLVEIQIHHKALLTVRKDLGGHFMYSKFRAIAEALETSGVKFDTRTKTKRKVLVVGPSQVVSRRDRYMTAPNPRLATKTKLKLRPKSDTKTKKKKKKKKVFPRPRFTTEPAAFLSRSRRRQEESTKEEEDDDGVVEESKYEPMDISPKKQQQQQQHDEKKKDKKTLRKGARKILSMSPTKQMHALESLLSSSPSRQKLVHQLLKGTQEELERYRRESRGESFCGDDSSGRFSSFSTTPPKSPMPLYSRRPHNHHHHHTPPETPSPPSAGFSSSSRNKRKVKIIKRSPIKVELSTRDAPPLTASLSAEFSPPESPYARMRRLRKSPMTVSKHYSDGDDEDAREESKLRCSLDVTNTPTSPLIRKKAPSLTLDQEFSRSPKKKFRKDPNE